MMCGSNALWFVLVARLVKICKTDCVHIGECKTEARTTGSCAMEMRPTWINLVTDSCNTLELKHMVKAYASVRGGTYDTS